MSLINDKSLLLRADKIQAVLVESASTLSASQDSLLLRKLPALCLRGFLAQIRNKQR